MVAEYSPHAPLCPSGAGKFVHARDLHDPDHVQHLTALLQEHRFVALRGAADTLEDAVKLMRAFGPLNEAKTRQEGAVLVEDQGGGEVFRSNFALPLHRDGVLTGYDVRLVGIYCVAFDRVTGGQTFVSDVGPAMERFAPGDRALLEQHGCEAKAVDSTGYYQAAPAGRWHPFPAFRALPGREPSLSIGLPHAPGEPESWRIRIPDVGPEVSERILAGLRDVLLDDAFLYRHAWQPGDLLLMDNYAVMHGRDAFTAERRALANIQVLAPEVP